MNEFGGNWIHFPPTIHEFYAHTAVLMGKDLLDCLNPSKPSLIIHYFPELNDSHGLKSVSEENLEKLHKVILKLKSTMLQI